MHKRQAKLHSEYAAYVFADCDWSQYCVIQIINDESFTAVYTCIHDVMHCCAAATASQLLYTAVS